MSDHINLLSHKRKSFFNKESIILLLQFLAKMCLVVTIISSIVLFILNNSGKLPLLEQQGKTISTNLSLEQQKIIKFLLIRERVQNITPLLGKKSQIDTLLSQISSSLPNDASMDSFTLSQKTITIVVSSSSLISINSFLDFAIEKVNQKQLFKKITVTSLSIEGGGNKYRLAVSALYYE